MGDLIKAMKVLITLLKDFVEGTLDTYTSGVRAWVYRIYTVVLGVTVPIINSTLVELQPILQALVNAFNSTGPTLLATVRPQINAVAAEVLANSSDNLTKGGPSTLANCETQAAAAFTEAFGYGISSGAITAAFEACFPEKLNTLNGVGPMLAKMAGFDEVAAQVRNPLYRAAFGRSLEYKYLADFTPEVPPQNIAAQWLSRGIITQAQYDTLYPLSGQKVDYKTAWQTAAYRPVPPFLLARAAEIGAIPAAALNDALAFSGFRPADITTLISAYAALAQLPYQTAYIAALKRNVELGTDTPAELSAAMDSIGWNADIQNWVQLEVATRKLEQLAELYRKSVSEAYKYGIISDSNYIASLEAVGIDYADAQAHYVIDSYAKNGKALIAAAHAEAALEQKRQSAAVKTATAAFQKGVTNAEELGAALVAARLDPEVAGFAVTFQEYKSLGNQVFVYGVLLSRGAALQLKEKVAAIESETKKQLITPDQASAQLEALGLPDSNRIELIQDWSALLVKPTTYGHLWPESPAPPGPIATFSVASAGFKYAVGDTGSITGGIAFAQYVVTAATSFGQATISITDPGSGYTAGQTYTTQPGGAQPGAGFGLTVTVLTTS